MSIFSFFIAQPVQPVQEDLSITDNASTLSEADFEIVPGCEDGFEILTVSEEQEESPVTEVLHPAIQPEKLNDTELHIYNIFIGLAMLMDLTPSQTNEFMSHIFSGAHIRFADGGAIYEHFCDKQPLLSEVKNPRVSSHQSVKQQYGFSGPVMKELLIGQTANGETWMQMEGHGTRFGMDLVMHLVDYAKYKITGRNIGPLGNSMHTENGAPLGMSFA